MRAALRRYAAFWKEFAHNRAAVVSLFVVVGATAVALLAPYLGLPDPMGMTPEQYQGPSASHWLGTDNFGRDILSRVIWGTRLALSVAFVSSAISTLVGIILGALSGYYGGWVDDLLSRTFDIFLLIPAFFLVILVVALFGNSILFIMLAIAATTWPRAARIMRSQVLTLKSRTFVQASLAAGASNLQVLFRHIIPNGLAPVVTNGTILMGLAILTEAGLSFLGLGDSNTVSWGRMIFEGQRHLRIAPWISIYPGIAMLLVVCAFNLLGDGLNRAVNPQLREKGGRGKAAPPDIKPRPAGAAAPPRPGQAAERPLLEVRGLRMYYQLDHLWVRAVDGVSFSLRRGGSLGIVGESGCGKSSLGLTLLKVLPSNAKILGGEVLYDGKPVHSQTESEFREIRWQRMAMIFQSAMNALNPVLTVGQQLSEAYRLHRPEATRADADARIAELFDTVGIPRWRVNSYPHELSGGMRQRVIIALSLLLNPELIIADEPTTALDVLVQDQILAEIDQLRRKMNLSLILISHDMGTVAETCERIAVMYAGEIVEEGPTDTLFDNPRHPYTQALLGALPTLSGPKRALTALPGEPFVALGNPVGCRFASRCPFATDKCREQAPPAVPVGADHTAACHYALEVRLEPGTGALESAAAGEGIS